MDLYATTATDEAFLLDLLNTTPVVARPPAAALGGAPSRASTSPLAAPMQATRGNLVASILSGVSRLVWM